MIGSNAYDYIDILTKAASASFTRNTVLNNNLANANTPDYKRKDIKFEEYLGKELKSGKGTLDRIVANVDLSALNTTIYTDQENLSYTLDGNNVNPDTEYANLSQNTIRYYTLMNSMTQEFNRIKAVLQKG